jgi:hypothetical protein
MENKFYYKVDVCGKNGYSFMLSSNEELTEDDVLDVALENNLFEDDKDVGIAIVDDLITEYDIKAFGDNIFHI